MSPGRIITVATVLCFLLGLFSPVHSAWGGRRGNACCMSYSRRPVPFHLIKGYREQTAMENCRIEAIIFYTTRKIQICASRKDDWVKRNLKLLSSKLNKMSNSGSAAGEGQAKKSVDPTGSGSFFGVTKTFPNSTESSY